MEREITKVIKEMVEKKLSIREMATELGVPKSTLYCKIQRNLYKLEKSERENLKELFDNNKKNMSQKGGFARKNKMCEGAR